MKSMFSWDVVRVFLMFILHASNANNETDHDMEGQV